MIMLTSVPGNQNTIIIPYLPNANDSSERKVPTARYSFSFEVKLIFLNNNDTKFQIPQNEPITPAKEDINEVGKIMTSILESSKKNMPITPRINVNSTLSFILYSLSFYS